MFSVRSSTGHSGFTSALVERLLSISLGLSLCTWSLFGLLETSELSTPRLITVALNLLVGFLLCTRNVPSRACGWGTVAACVPAFVFSALVFVGAHPFAHWPLGAEVVLAAGVYTTMTSTKEPSSATAVGAAS